MKSRNPSRRSAPSRSKAPVQAPTRGSAPREARPAFTPIPKNWRIVAGTHAIAEVLKIRPRQVKSLWLRQGWESSNELREFEKLAQAQRITLEVKPESLLERFCGSHQGAIALVDGAPRLDFGGLESFDHSIVLMLDGLEDPHNLGAIVRTSWLVGAHGIFIPEDRAVGLTATAHKVACGGAEHVPVESVVNFSSPVEQLKQQGYWVFGLSHKAKKSLFDLQLPEKIVWAVGSEDKGLRVTTERLCDELVSIPQLSAAASYNASVATAMALTETLRQQAKRKEKSASANPR